MTPQRITLVTLGVERLERAKTFYCALGWTPAPSKTESIVFYQLNGLVLGLFGRDALAKDQERPASELGTGAMTLALNISLMERRPAKVAAIALANKMARIAWAMMSRNEAYRIMPATAGN